MAWGFALWSITMSVLAQFALKAGMNKLRHQAPANDGWLEWLMAGVCNYWLVSGFVLYGIGAMLWLRVLSEWDVSKAYPLVGLGFILTSAIGWWAGEQIGVLRMAGILLIAAGVFCVGRS
ncbi:EamA family transporter [Paucibacter sp. B2R-40]|nr:EamA family transporter [Paucibacter sp. B2R-40]